MLFSPSRTLNITLEAIRQAPEHSEGIVLGMIAAVDAYDAELARGLDGDEKTQALAPPEKPKPRETVGARPLKDA